MKYPSQKKYLQEAERIGDELISKAEKDKFGITWKTMSFQGDNRIKWEKSSYLYDGTSGITLFLIELYRITKNKKYLKFAIEALNWSEYFEKENNSHNFAFYSGKTGIAYCFIKMYEITRNRQFIEKSLNILKGIDSYLHTKPICEFINGASGALLGLLHVYNLTREKQLLSIINDHIEYLLTNVQHGPIGFYWDRSPQNIRGLCGFSHGAAGIGFVFLELGKYFNNPAFYWIADQAFAYEDYFFNTDKNNWPDFRKGIFSDNDLQEHISAYQNKNWQFFSTEEYMTAWCHCSPGIGLSRLRAYEILKNKQYLNLTQKTLADLIPFKEHHSFTLCHGLGGIAETYLQAYSLIKNPEYLSFTQQIADKIIHSKKNGQIYLSGYGQYNHYEEDYSLLNGNAGIGLFLLRMVDIKTTSVLFPCIRGKNKITNLSLPDIKKNIITSSFPHTYRLFDKYFPETFNKYLNKTIPPKKSFISSYISFTENLITTKKSKNMDLLKKIFSFEKLKLDLKNNIKNDALYYMQYYLQKEITEKLIKLPDNDFRKLVLQFNHSHSLAFKDWKQSPAYLLLKFTYDGIEEIEISKFCYVVFSLFNIPRTVNEVIETFNNNYLNNSVQTDETNKIIISQIKEGLGSGAIYSTAIL